jgi:hypothetical protein
VLVLFAKVFDCYLKKAIWNLIIFFLTEHCENGIKDSDESDVDCGGSLCNTCPLGDRCNTNSDCEGDLFCVNNVCQGI